MHDDTYISGRSENNIACLEFFQHIWVLFTKTRYINSLLSLLLTLNASCMMTSGGRIKQLNIFCRVTGFMIDFLSFL